ncbi:glycosyltransferase family 4 protein [Halorientalis pallida]|uniref:Glycosyltransferase family 1 protein n=1 Tax=Halorientalis pallida TaxID=2479928 RepID=A0A498KSP5_9EURY|nr:glycosyltransferase family 1 protein [Halorientalis pallida]RXK47446.1 glycosyltransferase family 1 protein [Halorientalis pallida]
MSESDDILVNAVSFSSGSLLREFHLLKELPDVESTNQYHVLCTSEVAERLGDTDPVINLYPVVPKENGFLQPIQTPRRIFWENVDLLRWARRIDPDLLYFPSHISNVLNFTPKIVAVRNIAPFYPSAQPNRTLRESARLRALRIATRLSVRQAKRIVFFTQATLDRVAEYIPSVTEKAVVIPHGVPEGFGPVEPDPEILASYNLPEEYLLSVSNVARYKNYLQLVEGYAKACEQSDGVPDLCLVGKVIDDGYSEELDAKIRSLGIADRVHRIGFVDHGDLPHLHSASTGFLFSSACENAPITLIEALACGSAIASSNRTSMPEICGEAALYFDPYRPDSIADSIGTLATEADTRDALEDAALDRAKEFSWKDSARKTCSVFDEVIREGV